MADGRRLTPKMSLIIVTPDDFAAIRQTVEYLQVQSVRDQLELVIVAPTAGGLRADEGAWRGFAQVRVVEVGPIHSFPSANAAGVRAASADIVVFCEDHSYPDPDWAAALIKAHRGPWAVVGPVARNANPRHAVSWADFCTAYLPWADPTPAGPVEYLPGHNSSYKRAILLGYGEELAIMLRAETVLHWELRAKGYQLYLEPSAKTSHLNFERLSGWLPDQFLSGRMFASARARNWTPWRRLLYSIGAPLIPLVRLSRMSRQFHKISIPASTWLTTMPALIAGLGLNAMGEMLGYLCGVGSTEQRKVRFDSHRERQLVRAKANASDSKSARRTPPQPKVTE